MSFLDRIIAAVTPPETGEERAEARSYARTLRTAGGWLEQVLDDHEAIESAFDEVEAGRGAAERRKALQNLFLLLAGHSAAEEAILYPALSEAGEKGHAGLAYEEQAMAKVQLALLETIEPMSEDFVEKLGHLRGAVTHHMYQEESSWFLKLRERAPEADQQRIGQRYREEMARFDPAHATQTEALETYRPATPLRTDGNLSTDHQPKGAVLNPSDTLDREGENVAPGQRQWSADSEDDPAGVVTRGADADPDFRRQEEKGALGGGGADPLGAKATFPAPPADNARL